MSRALVTTIVLAAPAGLAAALAPAGPPLILCNTSPSEPPGLYVRDGAPPAVGRMIAFHPPAPGQAYARRYLPQLGQGGILKSIAAGPGERVCAEGRTITVNGAARGRIFAQDRLGRALPAWGQCRVLRTGEYFVLSDRIWNSFDSRYYGPVTLADMIGVYRPIGSAQRRLAKERGL